MPLTLITGPMFSGKTTHLISFGRRFKAAHKKTVIIKHAIDDRYTKDPEVISHDGITFRADDPSVCRIAYSSLLADVDVSDADCILVDEGQFFSDLKNFVEFFASSKTLVVSGLISDYRLQPFQYMTDVFSLADSIQHLTSNCSVCGAETSFTARVKDESTDQILVGSADSYEPRCRAHHPYVATIKK